MEQISFDDIIAINDADSDKLKALKVKVQNGDAKATKKLASLYINGYGISGYGIKKNVRIGIVILEQLGCAGYGSMWFEAGDYFLEEGRSDSVELAKKCLRNAAKDGLYYAEMKLKQLEKKESRQRQNN